MTYRLSSRKISGVNILLFGYLLLSRIVQADMASAEDHAPVPGHWIPLATTSAGQLYHRDLESSSVPMIMIATTFAANPARVHAVVTDYEHFSEFIPNVLESRVLLQEGNAQWVFHHLRFPGPVADRAYVFKSTDTRTTSPQGYRVEWQLAQRQLPGADRSAGLTPRTFSGFWELQPAVDPGLTEARYAVHSDPGGMLPVWLVGNMTERYVQQVIEAIRKRLSSP